MRSPFLAGLEILNHKKFLVLWQKPLFRSILEVPSTVFMLPSVRKFSRSAEQIASLDEAVEFSFSHKDSGVSILPAQVPEEIGELLALVERLRPKVVLEIGTERGGTLFLLTRVADPSACIMSIDLPGGLYGGGYPASKIPLYKAFAKKGQRLYLVRGDSHDPHISRKIREVLGFRGVDLLFIDGDHTFEGVKNDFETYSPMVRRGGVIVLHDILPHPAELRCRVNEFWDDVKWDYRFTEIVKDPNQGWAGIGVLQLEGAPKDLAKGSTTRHDDPVATPQNMASGQPLVSVVIPNWNGKRFLSECLESLRLQTYTNVETILVDNGSDDGSVEFIRSEFPEVQLVVHTKNLGFAEGTNTGIRIARGEWIATLNNDTRAEPEWLSESVRATTWGKKVGMVQSRLMYNYAPYHMNSAGVSFETNGKAWDIGTHEPFAGDFTQPLEVFGPSAGGALYSSEMLREIGLFDSSFFAYFEDLDLAWRARLRGWRCVYCPTAVVHHSHGGTAKPLSPFVLYQCQRNRLVVMARYYPVRYLALAAPRIIGEFAAGLLEKIKKGSSPSYDGLLSGFRQFMSSVNGRKSFIESAVINPASLIRAYGKREKYHILRNDVTPESVEKHATSPVN